MTNIYDELAIDIVSNCSLTMHIARKVVRYLESEGILDYDILKEHYLGFEEDE